jgi:putative ABC transport system permease protein
VLRSLIHFWRLHLPVLLGAAVAATVLTGSLAVGDSMREGLRRLWLERLGGVELAAVAPRFLRAEVADEMAQRLQSRPAVPIAPLIVLRGTAVHASLQRRAARVAILGIDERFAALYPGAPRLLGAAPASGAVPLTLNETLARQLGARPGDDVLLSWERPSAIPREMLLAAKDPEGLLATHRYSVARVVADRGPGSFDLAASQATAANAFLPLAALAHELGEDGHANALLVGRLPAGTGVGAAEAALASSLRLGDLGLDLRPLGATDGGTGGAAGGGTGGAAAGGTGSAAGGGTGGGTDGEAGGGTGGETRGGTGGGECLALESREFFLPPGVAESAVAAAAELGGTARPVLTYLAIELAANGRAVPYSMVAALGPAPVEELRLVSGAPAPALAGDEILLDSWAAEDLAARPGDTIEMSFFLPDSGGAGAPLATARASFRMRATVALAGLAADRSLTPAFPGIDQARDMASWSAPFPVDLHRVRPRDEQYWHRYGPTPKAFVSLEAGRRHWRSRFGEATSVRLGCPPGAAGLSGPPGPPGSPEMSEMSEMSQLTEADFAARLEPRLLARLRPAAFGLALSPVRAEGLRAAASGTDFSSLFVGFSSFLIVSSALLTGLLFTLGLERRAGEIGLLLALGYPVRRVRRRLLGEGLALAGAGALAGLGGAWVYAALLLDRLRPALGLPGHSGLFHGVAGSGGFAHGAAGAGEFAHGVAGSGGFAHGAAGAGGFAHGAAGSGDLVAWVSPETLVWGWLASVVTVLCFLLAGVRRMTRLPAAQLLAGALTAGRGERRRTWWRALTWASAAVLVLAAALHAARGGAPALAFGAGASLLAAGISAFALWCLSAGERESGRGGVLALGVRNTAANPARSVLSVALVACACFVLVLVAANRREGAAARAWGGFTLLAESATPLYHDLGRRDGRRALGLPEETERLLAGGEIAALSAVPGDDASCLNLYRSRRPPLIGMPAWLAARRFAFAGGGERSAAELFAVGGAGRPPAVPALGDEQSVRWILHLGIGDELTLADERGAPLRLRIAGLLTGSPLQGALLIPDQELARHFPRHGGRSVFLLRPPHGQEAAVAGLLTDQLRDYGFEAVTVGERLRLYARVEETYLASFQALGGLGLLLGTCGLAVVLLRNALERRWELAAMRAFGFRRRRLVALLLLENAALLGLGVALGTGAGLLPEALGAGLAGSLAWRPLTVTLAAVLAAGLLASGVAAAGALGAPLLPVLKAER